MCNNVKDMNTLALCIETAEQAECIRKLSPTHAQGFHFSDAISFDDFYEKFLK